MADNRQLWVLAGGNGAGKSTFYHTALQPLGLPFINADVIARELYPDACEARSYDAARIAEHMRAKLLVNGDSFCFETVFSHPSKIDFLAQAKASRYEVILVFIHLDDVGLNQARIAQRIVEGGHGVPAEKVASRIPRTLANIKTALPLCDRVYVLANQSFDNPFAQLAELNANQLVSLHDPLPAWAGDLLADYV